MIELMDWAVARWAAFMWPIVWQATVVAAIALTVLIPWIRRLSPSLGLAVAAVALLKFFVPAVVLLPIAIVDRASGWLQPLGGVQWFPESLMRTLMVAHLAGAGAMLIALGLQRRRLIRARLSGVVVEQGPLYEDFCAAAQTLRMKATPTLILTEAVDAPVATGVRSAVVMLPSMTMRLTRDELRLVLAHELVHHKMRDLLGETALALATAVWWFHPAVWALASRVRELREERCDAIVVRNFTDVDTYCRALLAVAASALPRPAIAMRRRGHPLGRRFERLLAERPPRRWQLALATTAVCAFAFTALPNTPGRDEHWREPPNAASIGNSIRERVRIREVREIRIP